MGLVLRIIGCLPAYEILELVGRQDREVPINTTINTNAAIKWEMEEIDS